MNLFQKPRIARPEKKRGGGRAFLLGALLVASVLIVLISIFLALSPWARPGTLAPVTQSDAVSLQPESFSDEATVRLVLTRSTDRNLTSPMSGRLTGLECVAGSTLVSGQRVGSIDGASIVALSTPIPLYRDLGPEDTGEDVRALQQALSELGYPTAADGRMGDYTLRQVTNLLDGERAPRLESVPFARFLWIPRSSVEIAACPGQVGVQVDTNTALVSLPAALSSARLTELPQRAVAGLRVISVPGLEEPLAVGEGSELPSTAIDALAQADLSQAEAGASGDGQGAATNTYSMEVRWALATALEVVSVPPTALYSLDSGRACLQDPAGQAYPVTLVGSELGTSLVTLDAEEGTASSLPQQATLSPDEAVSCR